MLNVPFVNPSDATKGLQLNSDITVANPTASADAADLADQIWVWVPTLHGYRSFFRYAGDTNEGYDPGWCDADDGMWPYIEETDDFKDGIPLGTAIYYKAKEGNAKTFTGAGAIEAQDEYEIPLNSNNYTMFGNPHPTTLQLNGDKFSVKNPTASADAADLADQIWVWVPTLHGYRSFFRYAGDTNEGYDPGWCDADDGMWPYIEETDDFKDGISSGTAMYYKAKADASGDGKSAIFISPLAK